MLETPRKSYLWRGKVTGLKVIYRGYFPLPSSWRSSSDVTSPLHSPWRSSTDVTSPFPPPKGHLQTLLFPSLPRRSPSDVTSPLPYSWRSSTDVTSPLPSSWSSSTDVTFPFPRPEGHLQALLFPSLPWRSSTDVTSPFPPLKVSIDLFPSLHGSYLYMLLFPSLPLKVILNHTNQFWFFPRHRAHVRLSVETADYLWIFWLPDGKPFNFLTSWLQWVGNV